jgi:hypothetical protein
MRFLGDLFELIQKPLLVRRIEVDVLLIDIDDNNRGFLIRVIDPLIVVLPKEMIVGD